MEYGQFVEDVKNCIRFRVKDEYEVTVNRVMKNNSVELDGIVFFKEGDNISPNIYLNSYYEKYQEGETMDRIVSDIISMYELSKATSNCGYSDFDFSFEKMKDKIVYRLVNYYQNRKLLKEVPHIRFLDLAITFHCLMREDENGIGTIRITNEHMHMWEVEVKQLMCLAAMNTKRMFPVKLTTMQEMIMEIMRREYEWLPIDEMEKGISSEEALAEAMMEDMLRGEGKKEMFIATNTIGINGATVLIYQDMVREFASKMRCDFYILPSSIHEVILVPYEDSTQVESLQEMVNEVNLSQVPEEEILSDRVYIYRRKTNSIEIA